MPTITGQVLSDQSRAPASVNLVIDPPPHRESFSKILVSALIILGGSIFILTGFFLLRKSGKIFP